MQNRRINTDLETLIDRLADEQSRKFDVLATRKSITAELVDGTPTLILKTREGTTARFPWNSTAGGQIAEKLGIPVKYFRKLEGPSHAAELVRHLNYWFQFGDAEGNEKDESDTRHFIRCMTDESFAGGHVRAFLSDRYRVIDNLAVVQTGAEAALKACQARDGRPEAFNWNLTENRVDLLIIDTTLTSDLAARPDQAGQAPEHVGHGQVAERGDWTGDLSGTINDPRFEENGVVERMATAEGRSRDGSDGGDLVYAGVHISNSETGKGGLWIRPCALRAVCSNRVLIGQDIAKMQAHKGAELNVDLLTTPELMKKENEIVFERMAAAVTATFDAERFEKMVDRLRDTKKIELPSEAEAADKIVARENWSEERRDAILAAFKRETAPERVTVFDAVQAVTEAAQAFEAENPEATLEMELAAGEMVTAGAKENRSYFGVSLDS